MYPLGCVSLEQGRIQMVLGMPRTCVGTQSMGECIGGLGGWIGIQSAQERVPTPVTSDEDEEEMNFKGSFNTYSR
jgi:hypothetical protein